MNRFSIPARIFLAFSLTLVVFVTVVITSIVQHDRTARTLRLLHDGYLPLAMHFNEARAQQSVFRQQLERLRENPRLIRNWFDAARQVRPGTQARFQHRFEKAERLANAAEDARTLSQVRASFRQVLEAYERTSSSYEQLFAAIDSSTGEEIGPKLEELMQEEREISRHYRDGYNHLVDRIDATAAEAAQRQRQASIVLGVLALLALGVGLFATIWSQRVLRPLPILQERVAEVAAGDFSSHKLEPSGNDELARLAQDFEHMVEALAARDSRLRDLRRMQEQIVAGLRAAILVLDHKDRVQMINPQAQIILDLQADSIGKHVDDVLEKEDFLNVTHTVRKGGEALTVEAMEFSERRLDAFVTPFGTDSGEILWVVEDVTDALRTKARLIRTERLAAIGRMAAHVTHEVRNPLSSIGLNVEMLEDEFSEGATEARALMKEIHKELDRLTAITEEYLRLGRLPEPRLETDDIGEFMRGVGAFVQREMEASGVEFRVEIDEDLPLVAFDETQLRQALLNLLRNAREAMDKGIVELSMSAAQGGVVLRVRDQGSGIPVLERDRIFDLFYSTKKQGTGLGLPLTQQIIASHGGRIRCEEAKGGGTVFEIWLPHISS